MEDQLYFCAGCLIALNTSAFLKRVQRGVVNADLCEDCRDFGKPIKTVYTWKHPVLGTIICVPHRGEVDDDLNPINKAGKLYMPGERICGLKDCVKRSHIVKHANKKTADPIETILALSEARKNPARHKGESGRVTERGSVS